MQLYTIIGCSLTDRSFACSIIGCRQNGARIGWSINFCIQSVFSYSNYIGSQIYADNYVAKLVSSFGMQTNKPAAQAAGQTLPDASAPVGKIHPFSKIAITFEPIQQLKCLSGFGISEKMSI